MKIYRGCKDKFGGADVTQNGRALSPRFDLKEFGKLDFGYSGRGPAQLSLAILSDYLNDDYLALNLYREFTRDIISKIDADKFEMDANYIETWLSKKLLRIRLLKVREKIRRIVD